ncbi:hypothetical protein E2I00_006868, partial [Balaenoptera physalus]
IRASGRSQQSPESLLQSRDGLVSSPRGNPALQRFLCTRGFPTPPSLSLQSWFPLIDIQRPGDVTGIIGLWRTQGCHLPPGSIWNTGKAGQHGPCALIPRARDLKAGSVLGRQFPPKPHGEGTWRKQPKGGPAELPALVSTLHAVPVVQRGGAGPHHAAPSLWGHLCQSTWLLSFQLRAPCVPGNPSTASSLSLSGSSLASSAAAKQFWNSPWIALEKIRVPLPLLASQIPPIDDVVQPGTLAAFRGKTWQADAADRTAPFPPQGWGELRQGPSQL